MQLPRRPELAFSPACSGASLSLGSALSAGQVGPPAMTSSLCLVQGFLSVYGEPGECLEGNFFFPLKEPSGGFLSLIRSLQIARIGHTVYQGSLDTSPLMFQEGLQVSSRPLFW